MPAAQLHAALTDLSFIALRQRADKVISSRQLGSLLNLLLACLNLAICNIKVNRIAEEENILLHQTYMIAQVALFILSDIYAVKQHSALRRLVKAQQQACQRRFACTRSTHKGHLFTGSNIKIKMLQHRLILQIAKGYILKGNAALNLTCSNRIRRIVNLHLMLHHLIEAIVTGHTALVHFRKHQQTENRLHKNVDI